MVKIVLRERESVQEAVRRFRKIVERSGLKRELRRRERFEKPSAVKRRAKLRAIRRSKAQSMPMTGPGSTFGNTGGTNSRSSSNR